MYLAYLNHYDIRQCEAQYLWVLHEMLGRGLEAHFIVNEDYVKRCKDRSRWEVASAEKTWGKIEDVTKNFTPRNYSLMKKPEELIGAKYANFIPSKLLRETVYNYLPSQVELIKKILKEKDIKAGITWVNNKCFKEVLEGYGIPVIHHELGPFREETYIPTVYLDFSGVNGNTEFNERFKEFLQIADSVPILNREELIKIISPNHWHELIAVLNKKDYEYEAGVGLQVEVDTNLLLFNDGVNWVDPILAAQAENSGKILVRRHPASCYTITPNSVRIVADDIKKNTPYDFIGKCKKVYCLNSSVGIEAMMLGRGGKIYGDSPFREICKMDSETQLKALNFVVFGYLTHRDLLFNDEYYTFRLKARGNEKLIYLDNMRRLIRASQNGGKIK